MATTVNNPEVKLEVSSVTRSLKIVGFIVINGTDCPVVSVPMKNKKSDITGGERAVESQFYGLVKTNSAGKRVIVPLYRGDKLPNGAEKLTDKRGISYFMSHFLYGKKTDGTLQRYAKFVTAHNLPDNVTEHLPALYSAYKGKVQTLDNMLAEVDKLVTAVKAGKVHKSATSAPTAELKPLNLQGIE